MYLNDTAHRLARRAGLSDAEFGARLLGLLGPHEGVGVEVKQYRTIADRRLRLRFVDGDAILRLVEADEDDSIRPAWPLRDDDRLDEEEQDDDRTDELLAEWEEEVRYDTDWVELDPHFSAKDLPAAERCMLTGVECDAGTYLAIGATGMDLSARWDAFIALTQGVLPEDSWLLRDREYARHILPDDVIEDALAACRLEQPRLVVSMDLSEEDLR